MIEVLSGLPHALLVDSILAMIVGTAAGILVGAIPGDDVCHGAVPAHDKHHRVEVAVKHLLAVGAQGLVQTELVLAAADVAVRHREVHPGDEDLRMDGGESLDQRRQAAL